jgi:hypothetical protein
MINDTEVGRTKIKEAYNRGLKDGEINSLEDSVERAHDRIDKHEVRMTALERVMYAGMGVLVMIQVMPQVAIWATK